MEIFLTILFGVLIGVVVGFVIAQAKSKELRNTIDKLQWQLDNEKSNAKLVEANFEKLLDTAKSDAKEQIVSVKADCEKRVAEIKADCEKQ